MECPSSHRLLPNYAVASFVKKLARIALFAPPYAAVYCIVLIHDLLHSHPATQVLIHRTKPIKSTGGVLSLNITKDDAELPVVFKGQDPFRFNEKKLTKTRAEESTLWEIESLKQHYNPTVAEYASRFMDKWQQDAKLEEIAKVGGNNPDARNLDKRITFPRPDIFSKVTFDSMIQDELHHVRKKREKESAWGPRHKQGAKNWASGRDDLMDDVGFEYERKETLFEEAAGTDATRMHPFEWFKF